MRGEFRLIFADHRGQGGSDKPYDASSYTLPTRVGDAVAVLDALGIGRAHFFGSSWGARLGFALGEHAPERVLSLVLCGNQPYAWDFDWPIAHAVGEAIAAARQEGMTGFVETFESALDYRFPEPERTWTLTKNDPAALEAAWRSAQAEGPISQDLSRWQVPCLICAGEADEMHDDARRAAAEIPRASFVSLAGHSHISAFYEADDLLLPTSSSSCVRHRLLRRLRAHNREQQRGRLSERPLAREGATAGWVDRAVCPICSIQAASPVRATGPWRAPPGR